MEFSEPKVTEILDQKRLRDHANHRSPCLQGTLRKGPHETDITATVDHGDPVAGQTGSKETGGLKELGVPAWTGTALHADGRNRHERYD